MEKRQGKLVVISGPAGVGKSTITRQAVARTGVALSVSATTRPPRPGEVDGQAYRFIDRPAFDALVAADGFLEYADVFGQCYGTPAAPVRQALEAGRTMILEIDVQGGLQVAAKMPDATFILIVPPSEAELERRLVGRGTETADQLARRLGKATRELAIARDSGVYKIEVVNDDLERAVEEVCRLVIG
ncbi:MAG: guanylate kinase [Phycisphaerae bacterium]|nr:guanylate kinase [Phycisphaerae bacterium]